MSTQFINLKKSLKILHFLSITHNDIKPNNIIYSPRLKKLVFIDFGFAQMNRQNMGQMKFENLKGTFLYCSE